MATEPDDCRTEYLKCSADVAYFCDNYLTIDDAQALGDGTGTMPFRLWPAQIGVLWKFMAVKLLIVLKARQLGISWLACAYALWLCLFQFGRVVLIFSKGQAEAVELVRRVRVMYQRLPSWLFEMCPRLTTDNTEELAWSNGSRVMAFAVTEGGGRSYTGSLVILDEAAYIRYASEVYDGVKPVIDAGGQMLIISTANYIGNLFHRIWMAATAGLNNFETVFLPWWARPGRDRAWRLRQDVEMSDPSKAPQEYPANPTEAFIASGRVRFASGWLKQQVINIRDPFRESDLPADMSVFARSIVPPNSVRIYALPVRGRRYVLGADVAEGVEHGDFSDATIIDAVTWEEMANLHGHFEPNEFGELLQTLAAFYDAEICPERNNHGHSVLNTLKRNGARKVVDGLDKKRGWLTTAQSKPMAIDLLAEALRDNLCIVRTKSALDEMQIYAIQKNGGTSAPEGYNDDRVMSWAIALMVARGYGDPKPKKTGVSALDALGTWSR